MPTNRAAIQARIDAVRHVESLVLAKCRGDRKPPYRLAKLLFTRLLEAVGKDLPAGSPLDRTAARTALALNDQRVVNDAAAAVAKTLAKCWAQRSEAARVSPSVVSELDRLEDDRRPGVGCVIESIEGQLHFVIVRGPTAKHRDPKQRDDGVLKLTVEFVPLGAPASATAQTTYLRLHHLLQEWGVPVVPELADLDFVHDKLGATFATRDILVDCTFGGFEGIDAAKLILRPASSDLPALPSYVYAARAALPIPSPNGAKTYLERLLPLSLDDGGKVLAYVGERDKNISSGRFDYWTTQAIRKCSSRIYEDIRAGHLLLEEFPRPLFHAVTVVTADQKLILTHRSEAVDSLSRHWMTSVGESVDADKDRDDTGVPSPIRAIYRCLTESDELNLAGRDMAGYGIKFLGLATPWGWMNTALLAMVTLKVNAARVLDRAVRGEHDRFAAVDFTPDVCLPLIRRGTFAWNDGKAEPLVPLATVALLLSLFSRFGADEIRERIAAGQ